MSAPVRDEAGESTSAVRPLVGVDEHGRTASICPGLRLLHARGCARIFVEGGGVTVSMFLEANLLDRLQMAIAPLSLAMAARPSGCRPRPR